VNAVLENSLNEGVVEGGAALVAGLEVEYSAHAACVCSTCTEDVTCGIPACEDKIVGIRNVEGLSVELLELKVEVVRNTLSDGVRGLEVPHDLRIVVAPRESAACTYDSLEGLGFVCGVAGYEAHTALVNTVSDIFNSVVSYCIVIAVAPPHKNVCVVKNFVRNTLIGIVEASEANLEVIALVEEGFDLSVDTVGVVLLSETALVLFVSEFIPDRYSDFVCHCDISFRA